MSRVTNVILLCSDLESDEDDFSPETVPAIMEVNHWIAANSCHGWLQYLNERAATCKEFSHCLMAAGINYLRDRDELARTVFAAPWKYPESVQLLIRGEEDSRFTVYDAPR